MAHRDNSVSAIVQVQSYREDLRGPFAFRRGQTVERTV